MGKLSVMREKDLIVIKAEEGRRMFLIRLALKNLTRHKRRVLITASIIAFGIAVFLIYDSVQIGINKLSFNNIRNLETGDLQVVNKDYWKEREELPLKNLVSQRKELMITIKKIPNFKAMAPQLKFSANLNNGLDQLPIIAYGVEPRLHQEVFTTEKYLVEGSMLSSGKYEAVLGKRLAKLMEFKVGDYLTLLFKTGEGTFNTIDARITGLLHTNNPEVNKNFVYIPLDIAQQALNLKGKVSQIVVNLGQNEKTEEITKRLTQKLSQKDKDLTAHSWREFAGEVIALSKAENVEKSVMMSVILLIAAVGIVNTIILSSLERTKEIGMMKALGLREREIILVFVIEAVGIGLIGGLIGSMLGSFGILYLNIYGVKLASLGGISDWGLPIMGRLYGYWNPSAFIFVIAFGLIVSLLASILPAYWAARKDPVEAIYDRY
ncbi:MAG: hypothetical protein AWU54_2012 [Candidatus Frackibacter sp. T328-2]|nr:MAG: hypothetical protein AWU54_2012 [Candidatus Frackibacter sp. T328-2]